MPLGLLAEAVDMQGEVQALGELPSLNLPQPV